MRERRGTRWGFGWASKNPVAGEGPSCEGHVSPVKADVYVPSHKPVDRSRTASPKTGNSPSAMRKSTGSKEERKSTGTKEGEKSMTTMVSVRSLKHISFADLEEIDKA
ncbi:hypothetical protein HK101_009108 [Irineochytrium annulatum]|nr:hypothetical protein HK101_009108 [Irineochytrium annulatum]